MGCDPPQEIEVQIVHDSIMRLLGFSWEPDPHDTLYSVRDGHGYWVASGNIQIEILHLVQSRGHDWCHDPIILATLVRHYGWDYSMQRFLERAELRRPKMPKIERSGVPCVLALAMCAIEALEEVDAVSN